MPAAQVVQSQNLGAREAGSFSFAWDGKTDAGVAPPAATALRSTPCAAAKRSPQKRCRLAWFLLW
jgi:hypothetical protein